ncbi:sunset domain-containing protein [Bacillus arachidis]|uniref:O-antigen ligase family protein n=1 Tax=Bacillus arachidis TaxID=2819290 RepID=A0ABS3P6L0_9BACI|nr:O-antigen ligase family protein [Bacillus arachidis]MBO1628457.1 O-antigen ligase family protein [Bacillus arachidis]
MAFWSNISAILFLVTLILLILCIISLFKKNGKAMKYGRPAVICLIISLLVSATITTQTNHPIVGFFANLCLILFFFFLVLAILSIIKKTGMAKKQFLITGGLLMAFVVLATIATPSTEKVSVKDKKLATEQADKKDVDKKKELAKKEADEKTQKLEEEQKRQAEEQAQKQQEEQKRQAEEQDRKQQEEQKRQAEEQAQKQQEEQKRQAEEQAQKQQEEQKRQVEEQARKQQEEQKRQVEEQARKQKEEQQRQAAEQASQKKSTVASAPTSNQGGSNGQPFQNNPSDDKETNTSCKGQIKGNANSKKYHVPGGQYYDSTKDNIVWFCSETDAKAAGYVKSKK